MRYCCYCSKHVTTAGPEATARVGWCAGCRNTVPLAYFGVPGWIVGSIVVLLQSGLIYV